MDTCKTEQHFDKILTRCVRESINKNHSLACSRDIRERNVRRLDAEEEKLRKAREYLVNCRLVPRVIRSELAERSASSST